ncbi:MAG: nucleotide-binding universal stress UspA family protein [Granulosicoccus sp.]|jgi:nucleotide-binding universal stress UspA family protein
MKNILVPTDFSACAEYAIDLGFSFAEFFDATLYLFACIDLPDGWDELSAIEKGKLPEKKQLLENANVLLGEWEARANRERIKLKTIISGGKFLTELQNQVTGNKVDFVIMGSHGISGKQEYFIGSNTQKAIRKLHVPIFVVKNPLKRYAFKNVVFASSFDANEKEPFLKFLDFIKWFTPKTIHLLSINTSGWFGQPSLLMNEAMKDFKNLCEGYNCKTHFYRDLSVDVGVRHFSEEVEADLIVVSNQNRRPLKRIFSGSNVEALVNHCEMPVLSLDFADVPVEVMS